MDEEGSAQRKKDYEHGGTGSGRIHTLILTSGKTSALRGTTSMCVRHDAKSDQNSVAVLNSFTASATADADVGAD